MTQLNHKIFDAGSTILLQGEEGHMAYIIESGLVEIFVEKENGLVQRLGTRGAGSIIGEMALVDNKPRTATIKAIEDCTLLEISRDEFETRLSSTDQIVKTIMQVILARYRDMMTRSYILGNPTQAKTPEMLEKGYMSDSTTVQELKLIQEIRKAVQNQEFILHYQPIVDIENFEVCGFEALMRWNHPEKGLLFPDAFIATAEDSGLITGMTQWAIEESCAFLARIQKSHPPLQSPFISVNFSAKDFLVDGLKQSILSALQKNDLSPTQFHLEITERLLMDQPSEASDILADCRESGLVISIDDFGTGYSSLSYLYYFPIDILKIDRGFIANMQENDSSKELVNSIISLGKNMGMSIIAEGIELQEQADALKLMLCDKLQGYHFSRPLPEEALSEYLAKKQ